MATKLQASMPAEEDGVRPRTDLSPVQHKMLVLLEDGRHHTLEELQACLWDAESPTTAVHAHLAAVLLDVRTASTAAGGSTSACAPLPIWSLRPNPTRPVTKGSRLFKGYQREGLTMSYTMDDFRRDYTKEHLKDLTPEERLEGLDPDEILQLLSPEEIENYLKRQKADETVRKRRKKK